MSDEKESKIKSFINNRKWFFVSGSFFLVIFIICWFLFTPPDSQEQLKRHNAQETESPVPQSMNLDNDSIPSANDIEPIPNENTTLTIIAADQQSQPSTVDTVSKAIPFKNTSARIKISNDPADKIILIKLSMLDSKNRAIIARAPYYASVNYNLGLSAEKSAVKYEKKRQFDEATNKYTEAQMYYADAETQSLNAAADVKEKLPEIKLQYDTLQKRLKTENRSDSIFMDAENLSIEGERFILEGEYLQAYNCYSEAVSLLQELLNSKLTKD